MSCPVGFSVCYSVRRLARAFRAAIRAAGPTALATLALHANLAGAQSGQPTGNDNTYSFNPLAVKRDPFLPPEARADRLVRELNRFEISEMQLVAIMTGLGPAQAMLVLPNGSTHIVQIGDSVGPRDGRVTRISNSEISIQESFKDFQGRRKASVTNLVLAQ